MTITVMTALSIACGNLILFLIAHEAFIV